MLTKDIYGKTLSTSFNSAVSGYAQYVKPNVTIAWLDNRHVDKFVDQISNPFSYTNDPFPNSTRGERGSYFNVNQALNGFNRQSFTWAVCDAKDVKGDVIKADGSWYAMPPENSNVYEFGWWSNTLSTASYSSPYSGYTFTTSPYVEFQFQQRKVNRIRIITSEYNGQISSYTVYAYNQTSGLVFQEDGLIASDAYYKDHYLSPALVSQDIYKIKVVVNSTKNPQDYARINEVCPIYEEDITDYIINYSIERTRDVHETSLPIGGAGSAKVSITFDNTSKKFNIFNNSSDYGKYMKKDLKLSISSGWRIKNNDDVVSSTQLLSSLTDVGTVISVKNGDIFPDGGTGNNYVIVIDPYTQDREYVLVSSKTGTRELTVQQRGYNNSTAKAHNADATVIFDCFEYVPGGDFYVDEWSSSSAAMTVNINASDWSKFLAERNITKGFLLQNSTIGDAVLNLLMEANFPKADLKQIERYVEGTANKNPEAVYSFNESTIDRSGNNIILSNALRLRLWAMPSGSEPNVKDIIDNEITTISSKPKFIETERISVSPDLTVLSNSAAVSSNTSLVASYTNLSFTGNDGATYDQYFNGVLDGYYIPKNSGNQDIKVKIQNGGARIYLDNTLVAEDWYNNTSLTTVTTRDYLGGYLVLNAGVPYKIRVEFFHPAGVANFNLTMFKEREGFAEEALTTSEFKTTVATDSYGNRDASFSLIDDNTNHHQNDGIYLGNVALGQSGGIVSDSTNSSVYLDGGYIRIPAYSTINAIEADFTYELYAKFNNNSFTSNGEYLSSFASASPANGFEFFYSGSTTHGFKIVTTSGVQTVNANLVTTTLSNSAFSHIAVTYKTSTKALNYYVNGAKVGSTTVSGTVVTQTGDITIGGRNASFTDGTGEVAPATIRSFYIDEFAIYKKAMTDQEVLDRYISSQVESINIYPFIYGNDQTIKTIIDDITLADLGRFYFDEENYARYEHYNRFFEPSIAQHSNVQYTLSGDSNILDADYNVQLQVNKVTVKIAGLMTSNIGLQSLWRADDPTTLAVVTLNANITSSQTSMYVSTTTEPPFPKTGYLIIDDEIIKYNGITDNSFLDLERGALNTTATTHTATTKVREVKKYTVQYDKAPAYRIKSPFITAITDEEPDQIQIIRFEPTPYTAELVIAATTNVDNDTFVYAEGTNPLTELVYFTSIAGVPVITTEQSSSVTEEVVNLQDNIRKYGLKEITIESPYITDSVYAKKIANFIISKMQEPVPVLNINIMAIPTIQLGDRIRISSMNTFDIINSDYWVIGSSFSYGGTVSQNLTLRKVV